MVVEATLDSELSLDAWDIQVLQAAAQLAALVVELDQLRAAPRRSHGVTRRPESGTPPIIGSSSPMTTLRENIARVAATDFTVLVQGESGTGKELVARQLHQLGRRRCGPFVAVNCAALVESLLEAELFGIEDRTATGVRGRRGKFEHADGGTLFLDEVSDLAPAAQAKLLRAIQELVVERVGGHASRRVDTRIVVATNKDLRELAAGGQFREDLFYRLSGVELHVPPLRARRQDIPELSAYFLSRYQTRRPLTLSAEAAEAMQNLRLARQRAGAGTPDRGGRHAGRVRVGDDWGSPAGAARRLCGGAGALLEAQRHDARVGSALRQARLRSLPAEQAAGVRSAGHQLSHAHGVSRIRACPRRGQASPGGVGRRRGERGGRVGAR